MRTVYKVHLNFPGITTMEAKAGVVRKAVINRCRAVLSGQPPLDKLKAELVLQVHWQEAQVRGVYRLGDGWTTVCVWVGGRWADTGRTHRVVGGRCVGGLLGMRSCSNTHLGHRWVGVDESAGEGKEEAGCQLGWKWGAAGTLARGTCVRQ